MGNGDAAVGFLFPVISQAGGNGAVEGDLRHRAPGFLHCAGRFWPQRPGASIAGGQPSFFPQGLHMIPRGIHPKAEVGGNFLKSRNGARALPFTGDELKHLLLPRGQRIGPFAFHTG